MVYLIYGQDLQKLNYYLDKIRLENVDWEQITVDYSIDEDFITSNLYSPPMLTSKRLIIFDNFSNFSKINFSQVHPNVNIVILQRGEYRPKLPKSDDLVVIEAKRIPLIFNFLDNLSLSTQLENLSKLLQILKTEEPNFVFHQLIAHFRRLILVKNGESVEKLADWQIEKYKRIAYRLTLEKLKAAYKLLLATEIEVKTGQKELTAALPILILKLTQIFSKD